MSTSPGSNSANPPCYELGLVMAGAISAGAYTAGVIDFLIEALEAFEKTKADEADKAAEDRTCPTHDVKIRVLAGASAGGMTAGIAAAALGGRIDPVSARIDPTTDRWTGYSAADGPGADTPDARYVPAVANNPLFRPWVCDIDIASLLGVADLQGDSPDLVSLLDSTPLETIAQRAVDVVPRGAPNRRYLADELHVILSVANLRGVPYNIEMSGAASSHGHGMTNHEDVMHFAIASNASTRTALQNSGIRPLDPSNYANQGLGGRDHWALLGTSALASGAFPIGLKPRVLHRPYGDYTHWKWLVPNAPGSGPDSTECQKPRRIDPRDLREIGPETVVTFACVDGGLINNEPLEYARRVLAGLRRPHGGSTHAAPRNPRDAEKASSGVILIDPFPTSVDRPGHAGEAPDIALPAIARRMFGCLKAQARFKPDELALASDESVYSRWMIAPKRTNAAGRVMADPLACGGVGGFGGFLDERFRLHDFLLGRRNCQAFLKRHFALPTRPDPDPDPDQMSNKVNRIVRRAQSDGTLQHHAFVENVHGSAKQFFPILPLVGGAKVPCPDPADVLRHWPSQPAAEWQREPWPVLGERQLDWLRRQVKARADVGVPAALERYVKGWFLRKALKLFWSTRNEAVATWVVREIAASLHDRGQLTDEAARAYAKRASAGT